MSPINPKYAIHSASCDSRILSDSSMAGIEASWIRASASRISIARTMSADIKWLDLDVLADVTIVAGGRRVDRSLGVWSQPSRCGSFRPSMVSRLSHA